MSDLASKLQQKIKTYKQQIEEAEEIAALNLAKFRKAQQELEETEERAKLADANMIAVRNLVSNYSVVYSLSLSVLCCHSSLHCSKSERQAQHKSDPTLNKKAKKITLTLLDGTFQFLTLYRYYLIFLFPFHLRN